MLEDRLRSSRLRAIATGVIVGQQQISINDATLLFVAASRRSTKSVDDVARQIIHDRGV